MTAAMTPIDAILGKLRDLQPRLEAEGVSHVIVFGSQARGTAKAVSDLDLAIEVNTSRKFSILDLMEVESLITDATGIPANAFMARALDSRFSAEIARDGIIAF